MRMSAFSDVHRDDARADVLAAWYLQAKSWAGRSFRDEAAAGAVRINGTVLHVTHEQYLEALFKAYSELLVTTRVRADWCCDELGRPSSESVRRLARIRLRDRLVDQIRRGAAHPAALVGDWEPLEDLMPEAPTANDPAVLRPDLDEAFSLLREASADTRLVVLLDWAGWDAPAIATHTGRSSSAVRQQLSRFRGRARASRSKSVSQLGVALGME